MDNNRGFSLVELIVTIAIMSVVMLAVCGMMASGSSLFKRINESETAASDMQIAAAQIESYALDCTDAYYEGAKVYFGDRDKHEYNLFYVSNKTLKLERYSSVGDDSSSQTPESGDIATKVTSFSPVITEDGLLSITITINGTTEKQMISLRTAVIHKTQDEFMNAISNTENSIKPEEENHE